MELWIEVNFFISNIHSRISENIILSLISSKIFQISATIAILWWRIWFFFKQLRKQFKNFQIFNNPAWFCRFILCAKVVTWFQAWTGRFFGSCTPATKYPNFQNMQSPIFFCINRFDKLVAYPRKYLIVDFIEKYRITDRHNPDL